MALKPKKSGLGLALRSFTGKDDKAYLVFRTNKGTFHVFGEVEAKEAVRQCGAPIEKNTRSMWESIWKNA